MLYITNKTERFSFTSGCVVRVAKRLKEDWFKVFWKQLQLKNNFVALLKSFIAHVVKCKAHLKTKFKCSIAMHSLVMNFPLEKLSMFYAKPLGNSLNYQLWSTRFTNLVSLLLIIAQTKTLHRNIPLTLLY